MAQRKFEEFVVLLHETDSVAVLKRTLKAGDELQNGSLRLRIATNIAAGHKIAVQEIPDGAAVRKYGQVIGFARGHIAAGEHVHTHNLELKEFDRDYQFGVDVRAINYYPAENMRYFQGYGRPGGRVGTRNYI